jgi:Spy/CpxP family protein refolding chaperone
VITTTKTRRAVLAGCLAVVGTAMTVHITLAQGGGQGGGGADRPMVLELSRLETLAQGFKFTKDQKPKVKAILDQAHTSAAPIRDALTKTRAAIAAAIQAGKPQAEIDSAVKDYAAQVTAMTDVETKALADVMMLFTPEQRANTAAVQSAFFMFRGIFIEKKWDIVANGFYGY